MVYINEVYEHLKNTEKLKKRDPIIGKRESAKQSSESMEE